MTNWDFFILFFVGVYYPEPFLLLLHPCSPALWAAFLAHARDRENLWCEDVWLLFIPVTQHITQFK